jgi:YHS domain-containing protein
MRVRAEPDAPRARHAGSEVFFCSEVCREQFLAAPKRYPLAP